MNWRLPASNFGGRAEAARAVAQTAKTGTGWRRRVARIMLVFPVVFIGVLLVLVAVQAIVS